MRHKEIATLNIEWYPFENDRRTSIFEWMRNEGLVEEEYEYSTHSRCIGGKVFIRSHAKEKHFAVATNSEVTYTSGRGRLRKRNKYHIMLILNEAGIKWLKQTILETNI